MMRVWLRPGVAVCLLLLGGCGGSSSPPAPTSVPTAQILIGPPVDKVAVRTARSFVRAFQRDNRSEMLALMDRRLLRRNRRERVARMLGVPSQPNRVDILRTRTFRTKHGR